MNFKVISMKFDPETIRGSFDALETIDGEAIGDTQISAPLSVNALKAISDILDAELATALAAIKSA